MSLPDELEGCLRTRELASALENVCFLLPSKDGRMSEGGMEGEEAGRRNKEGGQEKGMEGYAYLKACLVHAQTGERHGGEGERREGGGGGGRGGGGRRSEGRQEGGWKGSKPCSPLQAVTLGLFSYFLLPSQKEAGREKGKEDLLQHPSPHLLLRAVALYHSLLQESLPPSLSLSLPPSLPLDLHAIEAGLAHSLIRFGRHVLLLTPPSLPPSIPPSLLEALPSLLDLYETIILSRVRLWTGEGGGEGGVEGVIERLVRVALALRPLRLAEAYVWTSVGRVKAEVVRKGGREGGRTC